MITELGVLSRAGIGEELTLTAVHPGVDPAEAVAATGWDLKVSDDLQTVPGPTEVEIDLLRNEIDPTRIYLR